MMFTESSRGSRSPLRIGCGAGFSGDRWDAGLPVARTLAESGQPAVLMYETLAERTLALAQLRRRDRPGDGCEPSLEKFLSPVLRICVEAGIPIVGNFGAADPAGAAARLHALASDVGLPQLRIAVVEGDDLLSTLSASQLREVLPSSMPGRALVSANVYLGAREIADALVAGAQIVVTGRVADPALALGPMLAHFRWGLEEWDLLAAGTMAGHLLECGSQVTGGYFADPGKKDVPDLANVGFPVVQMHADGRFQVTKAARTGGCVTRKTVIEQLLYEIHDPAAYLTPDVVADISACSVEEIRVDVVEVLGVRGHPKPPTLKATVCHEGGWLAEGEISYAGPNAVARAQLAGGIVAQRLASLGLGHLPLRRDVIGIASVFADDAGNWWKDRRGQPGPEDVRLRIAAAAEDRDQAEQVVREVTALYTCGPAGGGGVRTCATPRLSSDSCFLPREWVQPSWRFSP
jgi:hypothetical protein